MAFLRSKIGLAVCTGIVVTILIVIFCNSVKIGAGEEVVLVKQPLFVGDEGVDPTSYKSGRVYTAPTTRAITVNVQPQQFELAFKDMMTSDGVPIDFHAALRVQITDSVKLIRTFGENWYERNVQIEFQNQIRQAVRQHGMNETAIKTTAVDEIDREVSEGMAGYFKTAGLPLKLIAVTMGRANPPDAIKNQRIETANQEQRVVTEQQRKLAEDQRKLAELSRAEADNAYRNAIGLSPEQFIRLEQIHMMEKVCGRHVEEQPGTGKDTKTVQHDFGTIPCSFFVGAGVTPVVSVK